jgi:hypothetical protein
MRRSLTDERGVAVIAAVVTLVLLGAVVSGSLVLAVRQARGSSGGLQAAAAFYAAEAGLAASLRGWDWEAARAAQPGVPVLLASGELATGETFQAYIARNGSGEADRAHYLVTSTGRANGPHGGRRTVALLLREPLDARWCCGAALTAGSRVSVEGGVIRGASEDPLGWRPTSEACADSSVLGPGVLAGSGSVGVSSDGVVEGAPAVQELDKGLDNLIEEIEVIFEDLAVRSDIELPPGAQLPSLGPLVDGAGGCDTERTGNWGEPLDPDHPCSEYLPVIHSAGDLTIETIGRGQGILLVEGDLAVTGDFEFHGLVIVLGDLQIENGRISGTVLAPGRRSTVRVGFGGQLGLSKCGVRRALRAAKLVSPHPLAQFSWLEILE